MGRKAHGVSLLRALPRIPALLLAVRSLPSSFPPDIFFSHVNRVPNIISASIAITFFGFFSGPLFAAVSSSYGNGTTRLIGILGYGPWNQNIPARLSLHGPRIRLCLCSNGRVFLPHHHGCDRRVQGSRRFAAYVGWTDRCDGHCLVACSKTEERWKSGPTPGMNVQ